MPALPWTSLRASPAPFGSASPTPAHSEGLRLRRGVTRVPSRPRSRGFSPHVAGVAPRLPRPLRGCCCAAGLIADRSCPRPRPCRDGARDWRRSSFEPAALKCDKARALRLRGRRPFPETTALFREGDLAGRELEDCCRRVVLVAGISHRAAPRLLPTSSVRGAVGSACRGLRGLSSPSRAGALARSWRGVWADARLLSSSLREPLALGKLCSELHGLWCSVSSAGKRACDGPLKPS